MRKPSSISSNGTTAAEHWHTYIYPRKAGLDKIDEFFVGTNGEFARTHYANMGILERMADLLPQPSLNIYWRLREKRPFRADEIKTLSPDFAELFSEEGMRSRRRRFTAKCVGRSILDSFDRFYLRERIPKFIGNGIALYNATTTALMPMLSRPWVESVAGLPRHWRLGDNWHRYALAELCPQLLEFPEEGIAPRTSRKAPLLYGVRGERTNAASSATGRRTCSRTRPSWSSCGRGPRSLRTSSSVERCWPFSASRRTEGPGEVPSPICSCWHSGWSSSRAWRSRAGVQQDAEDSYRAH